MKKRVNVCLKSTGSSNCKRRAQSDEKINLTSEPAHYHYDLTFDESNIVDVKFQLGNIGNADDLGEHSVTVSNIKWTEK